MEVVSSLACLRALAARFTHFVYLYTCQVPPIVNRERAERRVSATRKYAAPATTNERSARDAPFRELSRSDTRMIRQRGDRADSCDGYPICAFVIFYAAARAFTVIKISAEINTAADTGATSVSIYSRAGDASRFFHFAGVNKIYAQTSPL